ncbi:MAG: phosphopyruvate hydratase [Pseudomonadales bacterium]
MSELAITEVLGRRVWDSRGRPTVEVEVRLHGGGCGRAIAPAGASTGSGEALDLRDGGTRFSGYGVDSAVNNVNTLIRDVLLGEECNEQVLLDQLLIDTDGTANRQKLGGNAMIATSLAIAHAAADGCSQPLWRYLGGDESNPLPVPEVQIFGGGAHAEGQMDLQDFMVVPFGAASFAQAMEWVAEIYLVAGQVMDSLGKRCGVADEGGYWPAFDSNEQALETLTQVIEQAGFDTSRQVGISLDIAATQIYRDGAYHLKKENRSLTDTQWYELMCTWVDRYPVLMIEDPFVESDFDLHAQFTSKYGDRMQVVGDDLLVTNLANIATAREKKACNALLCKPNQAGTLTEAKQAFEAATDAGWASIVSARSGETEDVSIVHLAMGWGIKQLKVGSFSRSERMAKWNEALRLEHSLGDKASYAGPLVFAK